MRNVVGMLLRKFDPSKCCLCGQSGKLTGEHKIKLSALRDEFGNIPLYIGNSTTSPYKLAQSPKSKFFHFLGKICADCNSVKTQPADRVFHEFHLLVKESFINSQSDLWEDGVYRHPEFAYGSPKSNLLFRYFSKILCCRLAESTGPTPIYLARHALGEFDQNRVWLRVRREPIQEKLEAEHGNWRYAAHGGLVVYSNRYGGRPQAFHSSISIGPVQYIFWFRLHWLEKLEMRLMHRKFYKDCIDVASTESNFPTNEEELKELGLL